MTLEIAYYGDPILRKKGERIEEITEEIRQLVDEMIETMHKQNGIGLAAPQVKRSLQLFLTEAPLWNAEKEDWESAPLRVWINPKVLEVGNETWDHDEGCLSIPGIYGAVRRPFRITIEAMDLNGEVKQEVLEGWPARVFLHENDHVNGVLFVDRIVGKPRQELEPQLKELKKKTKASLKNQKK